MEVEIYRGTKQCDLYEKKNLKINFFNKANKEENSTAPQKANVMVEICWGISSVIYKKKES